jgi:hypothetical protein
MYSCLSIFNTVDDPVYTDMQQICIVAMIWHTKRDIIFSFVTEGSITVLDGYIVEVDVPLCAELS